MLCLLLDTYCMVSYAGQFKFEWEKLLVGCLGGVPISFVFTMVLVGFMSTLETIGMWTNWLEWRIYIWCNDLVSIRRNSKIQLGYV